MKKVIFYCILFSFAQSFAQGIQMNQTPLLYHPSFAGSTGGGRLAFSAQGYRQEQKHETTVLARKNLINCLSFDQLWKGIGWGLVLKNQEVSFNWKHPSKSQKIAYAINGLELMVSPKFTLSQGGSKYTFSPSISLGYSQQSPDFTIKRYSTIINDRSVTNPKRIYSSQNFGRWGYGYDGDRYINSLFQTNIGFMINSIDAYWGVSYLHTTATLRVVEERQYYFTDEANETTSKTEITTNSYLISYPTISMVSGRTIRERKDSKFSFTYQFYMAFGFPYKRYEEFGTSFFLQNVSLNLTATYGRFYVGVGGAERPIRNVSLMAGFQSKRLRVGASFGWKIDRDFLGSEEPIAGLNASVFFPR